jgi:3,4-dihydroxyphenylacetate 2,3-dioxygenase
LDYDTVIVMDSHWATTVEFVISAHEHREGKYTAEELPRGMSQVPYFFKGDPEFAESVV